MNEDFESEWWEKIPWIGIAGIIACIASFIALLLSMMSN